ncbi:uncharacterized protein LOC132701277 [Cylas formicarius]|uniref:uncharacterized protein LOC132701277 n=1 Tax=Cylas formicarius TaxID=197179 RepID=UPI00295861B3|nr:uncharacterized protein LOC132701277 [Cylas formicarius]
MQTLNEHFEYNNKLAAALLQFLPPNDRKMVQVWCDKLDKMGDSVEEAAIRSDYMWFLLAMLRCGRVCEPFRKLPPSRLPPLKQFIPPHVYETVLVSHDAGSVSVDRKSSSHQ